jgi:hypothetical protein
MSNHRLAQSVEVRRFVAVDQRCWLIAVGPDFIVAARLPPTCCARSEYTNR